MFLEVQDLSKSYGKKLALNHVSFQLGQGIYGLLGPNGAGKSTLLNIITGNIKEYEGEIKINGVSIKKVDDFKGEMGYMPQQQTLYPTFTGKQFLYYIASLKQIDAKSAGIQIKSLLKRLDLFDVRNDKIQSYSGGMKQRLLFAQALLGNPKILILDEPTVGMDPMQRITFKNLISELAIDKTIILSTHIVSDLEYISQKIIILSDGMVLKNATPDSLVDEIDGKVWEYIVQVNNFNNNDIKGKLCGIQRVDDKVKIRVFSNEMPTDNSYKIIPTIEDYYLYLFGEKLR